MDMGGRELPDPGLTCQPTMALLDQAVGLLAFSEVGGTGRQHFPFQWDSTKLVHFNHVSGSLFSLLCQGSWKGDNRAEYAEPGSCTTIIRRREIGACVVIARR